MKITVNGTQYKSKHFYVRSHYAIPGTPIYSEKLFHCEVAFPKLQDIPMRLFDELSVECERVEVLIDGASITPLRDSNDKSKGTFHIVISVKELE